VLAGLREKPQLVTQRDERGRNWLHVCCATSLAGRHPKSSIRTADVLMAHGIDLRDQAFTEGPVFRAIIPAASSGPQPRTTATDWASNLMPLDQDRQGGCVNPFWATTRELLRKLECCLPGASCIMKLCMSR
jgi:hypothetical protein